MTAAFEPYAWQSGVLWAAELDADGRVARANETLRRALREPLGGRRFCELVAPAQRRTFERARVAAPAAWESLTIAFADRPPMATDRRVWLRAASDGGALVVVEPDVRGGDRLARELLRLTRDLVSEQRDLAGERAELTAAYEREHEVAQVLQRALLPERLPDVEGVRLAARFEPGGEGVEVGGDWYDAIPLAGGRLALAVGDVAGKGLAAASTTGIFRNGLRALALDGDEPRDVLARLDRVARESDELATVLLAHVDPGTGAVVYASAGHMPALLIEPGRSPRLLEAARAGPLLVFDRTVEQGGARLEPGAVLVLYSDGLVERRGVVIDRRFDALLDAARDAPSGADAVCDHLLDAMVSGGQASDDVTLLAAERA